MKKSTLPKLPELQARKGFAPDLHYSALERWNSALAAKEDDATISILDPIGMGFWGEGVTAKRISAALRSIGQKKNVTVNINSPGGDLFEGIAIYNLFRDYDGEITTRVIGEAASAASVIAMSGNEIQIARAGFMMIHNVWVMAMGDRNALRDGADVLETFDDVIADVYAARSGNDKKTVAKMMDKETWLSGSMAIEEGFADALVPADEITERQDGEQGMDARLVDLALARMGVSRSERRRLNKSKSGGTLIAASEQDRDTPGAAPKATHDAGEEVQRMVDRFASITPETFLKGTDK